MLLIKRQKNKLFNSKESEVKQKKKPFCKHQTILITNRMPTMYKISRLKRSVRQELATVNVIELNMTKPNQKQLKTKKLKNQEW